RSMAVRTRSRTVSKSVRKYVLSRSQRAMKFIPHRDFLPHRDRKGADVAAARSLAVAVRILPHPIAPHSLERMDEIVRGRLSGELEGFAQIAACLGSPCALPCDERERAEHARSLRPARAGQIERLAQHAVGIGEVA